jgi:hypothetical protein
MGARTRRQGRISALARQLVTILLIGLIAMPTLVPYRTWAQDNGNENLTVRLKSREFVPVPSVEPAVERQQQTASPGERIHALVQFWQIPPDTERAALENAGVELLAYVPENTWFASMPAELSLQSNTLAGFRWIGAIQPEDRMAPTLQAGAIGPHATHDDGTVSLDVRFFADLTNAEMGQILARHKGAIETKAPEFHRFTVRFDPGAIDALANEDGVQWIADAAPPKTIDNDGSRARTNVNAVQAVPYNLSGNGVDLGEWDGGRVDAHVDFSGRLTVVDTGASVSDHATHVAGTMAGDGSNSASQGGSPLQWRGMAPGADIISYYWDNNLTDHNGAINTYGIELSQNSWGYTVDESWFGNCYLYGDYDYDAPDYDDIITGLYGKRISVIFAAGNERNDGDCGMSGTPPYIDYANIGPPGTAKNVVAVGATNSNDDSMTNFSSWGPMDDGRIKPDVAAPGCESTGEGYIHSTLPGDIYGGPNWCGTSMAAPAVSGIVGLLIEQYRTSFGGDPLPSTVKALLIQTAVDLDDATSYYNPGPDYASGYGRVDAQAAVDEVIAQHVREDQVSNGQTDSFTVNVAAGTPSLKVTLVWDDEPGTVNANPALVNNLDLVLVEPNGTTTHLPWVLDPANPSNNATTGTDSINNVEQVQVNNPTAGTWEVRVIGTNVPVGPQQYSLAGQTFNTSTPGNVGPLVYNSHTIDDDNSDNSSGNDDDIVNPGETIELYVDLLNNGTDEAIDVYVTTISTSSPYVTFLYNTSSGYGNIPGGGMATNVNDFDFEVDSNTPDGHVIHFDLNITASNGGPWSDGFDVTVVDPSGGGDVALISDQTELQAITSILDSMGLAYDVVNDNWDGTQGIYTSDYSFLSSYDVVVWYASGYGAGRLITQQEHDALELYLQAGGRLLVTGYDTLGSPTDTLLADLVHSSDSGDGPFVTDYTITDGSHSITDGPYGSFPAGTVISVGHSDHDHAEADASQGATTVAELSDGHDKIMATELASGGIVVYWNGNYNVYDWTGVLTAIEKQEDIAEPKRDAEGRAIGALPRLPDLTTQPEEGFVVDGVSSDTPPPPLPESAQGELWPQAGPVPQAVTTINFDDGSQPCSFIQTVALRNEYQAMGVIFDGPGGNDGGAILDQCGVFSVSGHSPPNFLAFNAGAALSDGGTPTDPEEITFVGTVSSVQVNAGSNSGSGQTLTMEAFNTGGGSLGSDTITLSPALQSLSISASGIARVVISSPASVFVLDDLTFDVESGGGSNEDLLKNTLHWLSQGTVVGDPHEPNDTPADCTPIFFDIPITDPTIDPAGDYNYFCFTGSGGQDIAADIDAWMVGSPLDPVLTLFDSDGTTVLDQNDDYPGHGLDSYLEYYNLPQNGTFYLRVRSYGHPCCGGPDYTYSILLTDITQAVDAPWGDDMESGVNGWTADGFWHQVEDGVSPYPESHSPTHSWWYGQDATGDYDNGVTNAGSLTSPAINIPSTAPGASLSFWSWYETETIGTNWDQRWVQISVDGGPFQNLGQLSGDPMQTWVEHTFDLSPYVGSQVRIRFYFDTIDDLHNNHRGWYVDGFLLDVTSVQPPGPIIYDSHLIDDDNSGESSGNGDGIVHPGETIEMYVDLLNQGSSTANNVEACISEDSPYVNGFLYNDCAVYGSIPGGGTATHTDDFDYSVSPSAPAGHVIHFTLDVTSDNGGPWTTSFDVIVGQPPQPPGPLVYFDHVIDDDNTGESVGNNDGVINPGETIELYVELLNAGLGTANAVNACLSEGSPYVNGFLYNACSYYGDIPGGGTAVNTGDFDFEVDINAPHSHVIPFTITVTAANGGPWTDTFGAVVVGPGPRLYIEPPDQDMPLSGGPFVVEVMVDNANDLGAFEFDLVYDPAIIHVDDVDLGDFLGSTGRSVSEVGPNIDNVTGRTSYGAFSFGGGPGPSGSGVLAIVTLSPQAVGESDLVPENEQLTDTDGNVILSTTSDGHVTVNDCFFADVDCDGDVDIVDIALVASHYGCVLSEDCYDSLYDMDNDSDIDIVDLQIVACYWDWPNGDFSVCYSPASLGEEPLGGVRALQVTISINPDTYSSGGAGEVFTAAVEIANVVNLGAFEFDLTYDSNMVQVNNFMLGDFLGSTGRTVDEVGPTIDNSTGTAHYGAFTLGPSPGPDGGGILANIELETRAAGSINLALENVVVTDIGGYPPLSTGRTIYLPIIQKDYP